MMHLRESVCESVSVSVCVCVHVSIGVCGGSREYMRKCVGFCV